MGFIHIEIEHSDGSRSIEQIGQDPLAEDAERSELEEWIEENERIEVFPPQSAAFGGGPR